MKDLLIFDMDGVLVDVMDSYRETISRTVEFFTGQPVTAQKIQEMKNQGGWNDDWALSFRLIRDAGFQPGYDTVVNRFNQFFHGHSEDGLMLREKWIAADGLFDRLARCYSFAIFTGRLHWEAELTLKRFAPNLFWPVVGADDVAATKPAPDGLYKIRESVPHERVFYLGDTPDDAMAAQAAGVPFVGVIGPRTPLRDDAVEALQRRGAITVMSSINDLERVLEAQ